MERQGWERLGWPEDLHPLPELLLTPAQGAGALQTPVVPEPGALVAVPLLPAEQVKGALGGRHCPFGSPRPCQLASSLDPGVSRLSSGAWGEARTWPELSLSPSPAPSAPRFRASCQKIIAHKMFDHIVLVFIFLNCITIALERPDIDPGSTVRLPSSGRGGVS